MPTDTRPDPLREALARARADILASYSGDPTRWPNHNETIAVIDAALASGAVTEGLDVPEPIAHETESGYARRRELVAEARLREMADSWERSAAEIGGCALHGDPASTLATVRTLESCARELRARLSGATDRPLDFAPPLPELGCDCGACRYLLRKQRERRAAFSEPET